MKVHNPNGSKERLKEMFERVNKVTINETFDVPVVNDKSYLEKSGDEEAEKKQVNKYDGGVDYPAIDDLKTDHESLDKIAEEEELDEISLAGLKGAGQYVGKSIGDKVKQGVDNVKNKVGNVKKAYHRSTGDDQLGKIQKYAENFGEKFGKYLAKYNAQAEKAGEQPLQPRQLAQVVTNALDRAYKQGDTKAQINFDNLKMQKESEEYQEIEGGLADEADPNEFDARQIMKGMEVEMEHTDDPRQALEIAMDHLMEIPNYYDELADMESGTGVEQPEEDDNSADALLDPSQHWVDDYSPKKLGEYDSPEEVNARKAGVQKHKEWFDSIMQQHPDFMSGANYPYNNNIDIPIQDLDSGNKNLWGRSLPSTTNADASTRMVYPPNIIEWRDSFIEKFGTEGKIQAVNGQYDVVGNPRFDQWRQKGVQGKADYYSNNPNEPLDETDATQMNFQDDGRGNWIPQGMEDKKIAIRKVEQPMGSGNEKYLLVQLDQNGSVEDVYDRKDSWEEAVAALGSSIS